MGMNEKKYVLAVSIFLVCIFAFNNVIAISKVLSWSPPEVNEDNTICEDLGGYKIYYGLASRDYSWSVNVGYVLTYQINGLNEDAAYYFATTAYDTSGNESKYSNEVLACAIGDESYYCDIDLDGYASTIKNGCCDGFGCDFDGCQTTPGTDCDDLYEDTNIASADNNCNGIDENCDGISDNNYVPSIMSCGGDCGLIGQIACHNGSLVDTCLSLQDNCVLAYYCDDDVDGYVSSFSTGYCNGSGCYPEGCQLTAGNDCNDDYPEINIAAIDNNCDGIDDDCNGIPDNNTPACNSVYVKYVYIQDINNNGAIEAVIVKTDGISSTTVVIDIGTGGVIKQISYFLASATTAMDIVSYTDINGNGYPEIGVLAYDHNTDKTVYEIRDIYSGNLITDAPSTPNIPNAPTGLAITSVSDKEVVLTWQSAEFATSYYVYRDGQLIGISSLPTFRDSSVERGLSYSYTVVAVNGSYASSSSAALPVEACYPPARIAGGTTAYYNTLQDAYNAAADNGVIQFRAQTPNQGLTANINKTVALDGGYNCDYTSSTCDASFSANTSVVNGKILIAACQASPLDYHDHLYYSDGANVKQAVIGHTKDTNHPYVYIIDVKTGTLEKQIAYFADNYTPLGATKYDVGGSTLIGVLGRDNAAGSTTIEIRRVSDGSLY